MSYIFFAPAIPPAAPAAYSVKHVVEAAPVESSFFTVCESICFGAFPFVHWVDICDVLRCFDEKVVFDTGLFIVCVSDCALYGEFTAAPGEGSSVCLP